METTYPTGQRVLAARSLPASDKVFAPETVKAAFAEAPEALQVELLRAVAGRADRDEAWLTTVAQSADQPASVQAEAALAMGAYPEVGNASAEEVGRRLFFSRKKVNCALCHLMEGRGGILGPDLSRLNMTEERLRESMDHPSREIAPKYQTLVYTLKSEEVVTGIKLSLQDRTSRDHDRLIVADGSVRLVPLGEIVSREVSPISMMPPALLSTLTEAEQKALVQFLLRARP